MISKASALLPQTSFPNGSMNLTEWVDYSWATELTFIIDVQQTVNTPTAGTLTAKFQSRMPDKGGVLQWNTQRLSDLTSLQKASWLVDGDWPTTLADYTLASAVTYQRTIRNFGIGVNLVLTAASLAAASGTPAFQLAATVIAKG